MYQEQRMQQLNNPDMIEVYPVDIQTSASCLLDKRVIEYSNDDGIMNGTEKTQSNNLYKKYYSEKVRKLSEGFGADHKELFKTYIIKPVPAKPSKKQYKIAKTEIQSVTRRDTRSSNSAYNTLVHLYQLVKDHKYDTKAYQQFLQSYPVLDIIHLAKFAEHFIIPFPVHSLNADAVELMRSALSCLIKPISIVEPESAKTESSKSFDHLNLEDCTHAIDSIHSRIRQIKEEHPDYGRKQWEETMEIIQAHTVVLSDELTPRYSSSSKAEVEDSSLHSSSSSSSSSSSNVTPGVPSSSTGKSIQLFRMII